MTDGFRLPADVPTGPPEEGPAARLCAVLLDASRDFERVSSVSIVAAGDLLPWLGIEWENVEPRPNGSGVSREAVAAISDSCSGDRFRNVSPIPSIGVSGSG